MEDHRRPYDSPTPPWEDAEGWVVARPEDDRPGYPPPEPAAPPEPWYATYGEDPYSGGAAQAAYWPAQPPPAPQGYWPGPPAAPPDPGFRWYREVAPGQWVLSDPPVSAYPANGATYPAPPQLAPAPQPAPPQYAPAPQPVPRQDAPPPPPPQYGTPARYEDVPRPVSAPVRREPPVDRGPGPWRPPPRRPRREPALLPDLDGDGMAGPPGRTAGASTLVVLSWTLCYFLVPVLAYLGWALTRNDVADPNCVDETGAPCLSPRGDAIEALVNVGPALGGALFLAAIAVVVMRRLTANWRPSMVGFAASVVGGAAATLIAGLLR